jgi:hypothetical protein
LSAHAEIWTPVFNCANGAFEIDQWETEQLALVRDPKAIAYFQQQAGTKLELNTDGSIELRDSNSQFNGWVDSDLVHNRIDTQARSAAPGALTTAARSKALAHALHAFQ